MHEDSLGQSKLLLSVTTNNYQYANCFFVKKRIYIWLASTRFDMSWIFVTFVKHGFGKLVKQLSTFCEIIVLEYQNKESKYHTNALIEKYSSKFSWIIKSVHDGLSKCSCSINKMTQVNRVFKRDLIWKIQCQYYKSHLRVIF